MTPIAPFRALVSCALLGLAGAACAQSSVTVFGLVDVNVRRVSNGSAGNVLSVSSNGLAGSRIGVRGTEDLGDGLQAGFWLESGMTPDTGAPNDAARYWSRRSTVSLISSTLGELRLGRDYTPTYLALLLSDPFGDSGLASITSVVGVVGSGAKTLLRSDNEVNYFLPPGLGGVFGGVMLAPGEGVDGARYQGGRLGYETDALRVNIGYAQTRITADNFTQAVLAGTYDFGLLKVYGSYIQGKYRTNKQAVYLLGVTVPVGAGVLKASFTSSNMNGPTVAGAAVADADDARRFAVGYVHNLSVRTALYATAARVANKGNANLVVASSPAGIKGGESSSGYEFGIRHAF